MNELIERIVEARIVGQARRAWGALAARLRDLFAGSRERDLLILRKLDALDDHLDSIEELLQDELEARRSGR